jgi:hypothetical protein
MVAGMYIISVNQTPCSGEIYEFPGTGHFLLRIGCPRIRALSQSQNLILTPELLQLLEGKPLTDLDINK